MYFSVLLDVQTAKETRQPARSTVKAKKMLRGIHNTRGSTPYGQFGVVLNVEDESDLKPRAYYTPPVSVERGCATFGYCSFSAIDALE